MKKVRFCKDAKKAMSKIVENFPKYWEKQLPCREQGAKI